MLIYAVRQNADLIEGRGPMVNIGYYLDKEVALFVANKTPGVFGSGQGVDVMTIEVNVCALEEFGDYEKEMKKKKALAKLTKEERKLLGIEE